MNAKKFNRSGFETDYLDQLQEKEKKSKFRNLLIFCFASLVVLAITTFQLYRSDFFSPESYRTVYVDSLYSADINKLWAEGNTPILLMNVKGDVMDTINDLAELAQWTEDVQDGHVQDAFIVESSEEEVNEPIEEYEKKSQPSTNKEKEVELPNLDLDIEGSRMAGNELVFAVRDFSSRFAYRLDLGNGRRMIVPSGGEGNYTYPRPGKFLVKLKVSDKDGNSKEIERFIVIKQKEKQEDEGFAEEVVVKSNDDARNSEQRLPTLTQIDSGQTNELDAEEERALTEGLADMDENEEELPFEEESFDASTSSNQEEVSRSVTSVQTVVDEPPSFPGGNSALRKFLDNNVKYPKLARKNGIQGGVYIQFIVQPDGNLTNIQLIRGIGEECDEEALRVVNSMPLWEPGQKEGRIVPVKYTLPIRFKLD